MFLQSKNIFFKEIEAELIRQEKEEKKKEEKKRRHYFEVLNHLRTPGKSEGGHEYRTHEAELKAVENELKNINKNNKNLLFERYLKAGNITLEKAAFETKDSPNKRKLLRKAKEYYLKAKEQLPGSDIFRAERFLATRGADVSKGGIEGYLEYLVNGVDRHLKLLFKTPANTYYSWLSIFLLSLSLLFPGLSLTGAVVGTAKHDFSFLGILFFVCSLVCAFLYSRKKK